MCTICTLFTMQLQTHRICMNGHQNNPQINPKNFIELGPCPLVLKFMDPPLITYMAMP